MISTAPSNDETGSPVRMVSIAQGNFDSLQTPSWSEFNVLMQQTKAMQERIETLEQQRTPRGAEEDASLLPRENGSTASSPDDMKNDPPHEKKNLRKKKSSSTDDSPDSDEVVRLTESEIEAIYDEYELPESTYTLLMAEPVFSIPFGTGIFAVGICMMCLVLAWLNELDNGTARNYFGLPAGVQSEVRMAQYLGIIIGVLMEDEIPQGLEIIGKGVEQRKSGGTRFSLRRIILPALLRLAVGYMFLMCLFLTVFQENTVLDIFFDVLALEFVESIDDVIFGLSKRGFFGHQLRVATNITHVIEGGRESHTLRKWSKRCIRLVYLFNVCVGIGLLISVTVTQKQGKYRCKSVTVAFGDDVWEAAYITGNPTSGDDVWEDANVITGNGPKKRLLIFSHFNGIYVENGTHHGRPKYTEQNKEDGDPFLTTTGAEIVYCEDIESWVFRHEHIRTSLSEDLENDCSWLLKSPETDSYDIIELAEESEWFVWKGLIESEYRISIECNECDDHAGCNYSGKCVDEICDCDDEHFGILCQYERPCPVIRSEKDNTTTLSLLGDALDDEVDFVEVYGRPVYVINNMRGKPFSLLRLGYPADGDQYYNVDYPNSTGTNSTGTVGEGNLAPHKHHHDGFFEDDDFFEQNDSPRFQKLLSNYTFVLQYTGRRWYGQIKPPGFTGLSFKEEEYHAFWNNAFSGLGDEDNSTLIISAPTSGLGSPVGVDFYEMRRRNLALEIGIHDYDYSPFGVLIPLVQYEGSGFFHCNKPE